MKTKLILATQLVGKTYASKNFKNVTDVDQLKQFSYLNKNTNYIDELLNVVNLNKYDVVFGWLNDDVVNELLKKNIEFSIILSKPNNETETILRSRAYKQKYTSFMANTVIKRNALNYYNYIKKPGIARIFIFDGNVEISDFLYSIGINLVSNSLKPLLEVVEKTGHVSELLETGDEKLIF